MPPDFLEHHHVDARRLVQLLQPAAKPQPDHAAALEPAGPELLHTAGRGAVAIAHGPAGALAEIEREDHWRLGFTSLSALWTFGLRRNSGRRA
jgi:hypothetical protein